MTGFTTTSLPTYPLINLVSFANVLPCNNFWSSLFPSMKNSIANLKLTQFILTFVKPSTQSLMAFFWTNLWTLVSQLQSGDLWEHTLTPVNSVFLLIIPCLVFSLYPLGCHKAAYWALCYSWFMQTISPHTYPTLRFLFMPMTLKFAVKFPVTRISLHFNRTLTT